MNGILTRNCINPSQWDGRQGSPGMAFWNAGACARLSFAVGSDYKSVASSFAPLSNDQGAREDRLRSISITTRGECYGLQRHRR
jgi:hypothetical protein